MGYKWRQRGEWPIRESRLDTRTTSAEWLRKSVHRNAIITFERLNPERKIRRPINRHAPTLRTLINRFRDRSPSAFNRVDLECLEHVLGAPLADLKEGRRVMIWDQINLQISRRQSYRPGDKEKCTETGEGRGRCAEPAKSPPPPG